MSKNVKRRKKSPAARLKPFWVVYVLLAVAAAVGLYYGLTWPGFLPRRVVVSGNRIVPAAEITAKAAISPNVNLWLQNTGAAAARVATIPDVKTAWIHRSLPNTVRIAVTERVPYAYVRAGEDEVLVDRDLRVLEPIASDRPLPVFGAKLRTAAEPGTFLKDEDLLRLRDDYSKLLDAHVAPLSLHFDKYGDLVATIRGGVSLLLGDDGDLSQKTPLVDPILSQAASARRKIAAVDLRTPRTPVVVYK